MSNFSYFHHRISNWTSQSDKVRAKSQMAQWLPLCVARSIHLFLHLSWNSSNCARIQQGWHKSKLLQKKHKTGKAELQYNACVVNRYYCELINQARKHSKYPLPVFVPQRATGLSNINTACVCAYLCVFMNTSVIPSQITIASLCLCACLCVCACVCAEACSFLCMSVCEHKQSQMIIP